MAAQKVAEERQAAESTRPKESAREVIWELEVRELSNKETVLSMKYPIIRSQFQDQVFVVYSCGLKISWSRGV